MKNIFVVMGSYADYDASEDWCVRAFAIEKKAGEFTKLLALERKNAMDKYYTSTFNLRSEYQKLGSNFDIALKSDPKCLVADIYKNDWYIATVEFEQ